MAPDVLQVGVGGYLAYLILKLVLDFLGQRKRVGCIDAEQWDAFIKKFDQHHFEDKQLLRVIESLESAIQVQTRVFEQILRHKN